MKYPLFLSHRLYFGCNVFVGVVRIVYAFITTFNVIGEVFTNEAIEQRT